MLAVLAVLGIPRLASAQSDPKDRAYRVFKRGNELYTKGSYAEALVEYQKALGIYDHPRIRLQIATTLGLDMRKPREAYPHLKKLMKGLHRLDADERLRARTLQNSLMGQLGFVKVVCATRGAQVTVDGEAVICSSEVRVVTVGRHQVVAKREGHLPMTREVMVDPAKVIRVDVRLIALADAAVERRRWAAWKPWTMVGIGVLIGIAGIPIQLAANDNFREFNDRVDSECGPNPCTPMQSTLDLEDRAILQNRTAIGLFTAGGLITSGGLVLLYMNRQRSVIPSERLESGSRLSIVPLSTGRGLAISARF